MPTQRHHTRSLKWSEHGSSLLNHGLSLQLLTFQRWPHSKGSGLQVLGTYTKINEEKSKHFMAWQYHTSTIILNINHLALWVREGKLQKIAGETNYEYLRMFFFSFTIQFYAHKLLQLDTHSLPCTTDEQPKTEMVKVIKNWRFHVHMEFYYLFITDWECFLNSIKKKKVQTAWQIFHCPHTAHCCHLFGKMKGKLKNAPFPFSSLIEFSLDPLIPHGCISGFDDKKKNFVFG